MELPLYVQPDKREAYERALAVIRKAASHIEALSPENLPASFPVLLDHLGVVLPLLLESLRAKWVLWISEAGENAATIEAAKESFSELLTLLEALGAGRLYLKVSS